MTIKHTFELSLQERMNISIKKSKVILGGTAFMFGITLILSLIIVYDISLASSEIFPGIIVTELNEKYDAQNAGLMINDRIIKINEKDVSVVEHLGLCPTSVFGEPIVDNIQYSKGDVINLTVLREGQSVIIPVTVMSHNVFPQCGMIGFETNTEVDIMKTTLNYIQILVYTLVLTSGGALAWYIIRGRKHGSELTDIIQTYTRQAYFLALGLTAHGNGKNISFDFYEIAKNIFPELKEADKKSWKKSGKHSEAEKVILKNKKYAFDLVSTSSTGKFVIKHFQKTEVNYENIKECMKIAKDEFGNDVLRLVCLADNFDKKILQKYDELDNIPTDLIIVTKEGFSALKISEQIH
jgi:hypothetical protein